MSCETLYVESTGMLRFCVWNQQPGDITSNDDHAVPKLAEDRHHLYEH